MTQHYPRSYWERRDCVHTDPLPRISAINYGPYPSVNPLQGQNISPYPIQRPRRTVAVGAGLKPALCRHHNYRALIEEFTADPRGYPASFGRGDKLMVPTSGVWILRVFVSTSSCHGCSDETSGSGNFNFNESRGFGGASISSFTTHLPQSPPRNPPSPSPGPEYQPVPPPTPTPRRCRRGGFETRPLPTSQLPCAQRGIHGRPSRLSGIIRSGAIDLWSLRVGYGFSGSSCQRAGLSHMYWRIRFRSASSRMICS